MIARQVCNDRELKLSWMVCHSLSLYHSFHFYSAGLARPCIASMTLLSSVLSVLRQVCRLHEQPLRHVTLEHSATDGRFRRRLVKVKPQSIPRSIVTESESEGKGSGIPFERRRKSCRCTRMRCPWKITCTVARLR